MTHYQGALLLDLDGTLVDTAKDFIAVIQQLRQEADYPLLADEDIRNTVSHGARAMTFLTYGTVEGDADFDDQLNLLLDRYGQNLGQYAEVFHGLHPWLKALEEQNIAWGIVTNKPWRFTEPLLKKLDLQPSNQVIICPDHVTQSKPHAEPLLLAAEKLQLTPAQCLYAGDHLRDIQAAHNAGMTSIACAYGYIAENDDINRWQANTIASNINQLINFVNNYFKLENHV